MKRKLLLIPALVLVGASSMLAFGDEQKTAAPASAPAGEMLPPGWTKEDMAAMMQSMTPAKEHEMLAKAVGVWKGEMMMYPFPGAEGQKTATTSTVTSVLDGRFIKVDITGEMPGMPGGYHATAHYGYDTTEKKFVSTWMENMATGIMNGTGNISADGKVMTWTYTFQCPLNKKQATMKQIETITGDNSRTLEVWMTEPKSGKEYMMLKGELKREAK